MPTDPALPLRFTFTDHLGTPLLQTDSARNVVWRAEYEPFGRVFAYRAGNEGDEQVLRLPGQEAGDDGNSTSYNVFRWYRSDWGRYTQADPLGNGGPGIQLPYDGGAEFKVWTDLNVNARLLGRESNILFDSTLYSYGLENPLSNDDPFGLWPVFCTVHRVSAKPLFSIQVRGPKDPDPLTIMHCGYVGDCWPGFGNKITAQLEVDVPNPPCTKCPKRCYFLANVYDPGKAKKYRLKRSTEARCGD